MSTIFITGATSGFGEASAHLFAENGWNIIISGRRKERLEKLETVLKSTYKVEVLSLCFDVRNVEEVKSAISSLQDNWKNVDVLLNNAGLAAGRGPIQEGVYEDWEQMIDTNVKGLLYMTREVSPLMIARKKGHIINIGSIAGKEVYENGNVYCASKFAVDAITKSMRIDLLKYGIKVTGIHPGAVETEFSIVRFKGNSEKAAAAYTGYTPLSAEDVAETVFFTASLPAHVCINDLSITCTQQAGTYYFHKNQ